MIKKLCLVETYFIPKFHILSPKEKKSENFNIFVHILAILEDFLTEKEKNA